MLKVFINWFSRFLKTAGDITNDIKTFTPVLILINALRTLELILDLAQRWKEDLGNLSMRELKIFQILLM